MHCTGDDISASIAEIMQLSRFACICSYINGIHKKNCGRVSMNVSGWMDV